MNEQRESTPKPNQKMSDTYMCVGVLELTSKYRYGITNRGSPMFLFKPYDRDKPDFIVGTSYRDLTRNVIAVVTVDLQAVAVPSLCPPPLQRVTLYEILGPVGDFGTEKRALLLHYCPFLHHLKKKKQHELILQPTPDSDSEERIQIDAEHGWTVFHIDPPGCRDIDDAIAIHRESGACAITIADVSAIVSAGSSLDSRAAEIGATFYDLEGRVEIPMLPPEISERIGSLLPGQPRKGVTLLNGEFVLSVIIVEHSYTYETAPLELTGGVDAHEFVENCMIQYNSAAAQRLTEVPELGGILRVQDFMKTTALHTVLGYECSASYEYVVPETGTRQIHSLVNGVYCHVSSPLRRYVDLHNQRVLKSMINSPAPVPVPSPSLANVNARAKANKRWSRDLTFLTHVQPGKVYSVDVLFLDDADTNQKIWVPAWKRAIRLTHTDPVCHMPGSKGRIQVFCDPTRRSWKERIQTALC